MKGIIGVLVLGIVIRLFLAFNYGTGDTGAVNTAVSLFIHGKEVYGHQGGLSFSQPPLALHILSLLRIIGDYFSIPFIGFWKILAIFSDAGITYFIYKIMNLTQKEKKKALIYAKWYMFNPIALFISGNHGQQESVWIFAILLSYYFLYFKKNLLLGSLSAGFAVSYKLPAFLLIPALVWVIKSWKKRFIFVILIIMFFLLSIIPEIFTSRDYLIRQVFLYESTLGVWGFSLLISKMFASNMKLTAISIVSQFLKFILLGSLVFYFLKIEI